MTAVVGNRHDILLLFDVTNGNPNGDPDAGNMPRIDPNTNRGFVSDVCLKRKVRNYVEMFPPEPEPNGPNRFNIMVRQGAVLENIITGAIEKAGEDQNESGGTPQQRAVHWLCREFYDVRAFGGVLGVGEETMKGSAFGQVRGPVQFTFAQSLHPITPLEVTITRCAVTRKEDEDKERTIGQKHIVPYALYAAKAYVSPPFAERTGFTAADLKLLFQALNGMFDHDRSAARGEMIVRGIYDFEHVGTQSPENAGQNRREARLGCYHSHKLLEGINADLKSGKEAPTSFSDYTIDCRWTPENIPKGVVLHLRHEEPPREIAATR